VDRSSIFLLARAGVVRTVANRGKGVDELRRRIKTHFGVEGMDVGKARCWTERQRQWLADLTRDA
jgi:putative protein kinase ArgK-like GTPase of G3E family